MTRNANETKLESLGLLDQVVCNKRGERCDKEANLKSLGFLEPVVCNKGKEQLFLKIARLPIMRLDLHGCQME